jgi:thiol-disulfide isomerase/thioredoxin
MVGTQAPNLVITQHIGKLADHNHSTTLLKSSELATGDFSQTLLVFYQSGCGPCEVLMQQLPQKYEALKKQGIRIISLSADEGETLYQNSSKDYPWPDKYCDFEGKAGVNFTNYVVKGTPTLILLDKAGKIVYRGATLDDLLQQVGKSLK